MKRFFALFLVLTLLLAAVGCSNQQTDPTGTSGTADTAPSTEPVDDGMDKTGTYVLDPVRNEAILDDLPTVTADNDGNARVYYQIFVGSFSDSDGDGIGDLRGIIERFDYLNDGDPNSGVSLGVEGIWLSPIFTSPSYHKYDASEYYEIDPKFGTMEDLKELIDLCHERGVQIILDLVINHTSTSHPWFQAFVQAHQDFNTDSEYYDFYSWSDNTNGTGTWSAISGTSHYYECNFSTEMPELNYDNEAVRQAMVDVAAYYLELGVDGFRFDAAKYIYYGETDTNYEFWDWYMAQLRSIKPDIYTVAEVWDADSATYPYFTSTNCFDFSMSQAEGKIASAAKEGNVNSFVTYVSNYIAEIQSRNPDAMLCSFIANHDMDRAAGFLSVSSGYAYVAANLNLLLPGSPFIYYGEEIGMLGSRGGSNTDANRRLAMLWGDGDTVSDPDGANYKADQVNGTVADQLSDGASLYNHYKRLIAIRKANPEIAYGTMTPLTTGGKYGGYLCTYEGSTVAVFHNAATSTVSFDISELTDVSFDTLAAVVGLGGATLEGTTLTIEGQTSVVLR